MNPAPSYMHGNREQVSRLDQHMDLELTLAGLVCCQPHEPKLEALGDCSPACVSICHTIQHTDPKFLPQCCIPGKKAASLTTLKWAVTKRPEKLNKERKQREMGMCCNVFSINLMWSVPLSKFSLCHRDLACKLAIVKGDVPWSLQDPEQCVGLTNFSCSPTCGSDWGMAQACSPYEISVSKVLPAKSVSQAACSRWQLGKGLWFICLRI